MPSGQRLENKVAIVTGAGTRGEIAGTGQAASILMAREGAKVLLSDIDIDRAEETLNTIEKEGGTAKIFIGDVTSEKDCEAMVNESVKQFGKLDILFNNVGGPGGGMVTEIEEEDYRSMIKTAWNSLEKLNDLEYPNLYYSIKSTHEFIEATQGEHHNRAVLGYTTSTKTRPLIVAKFEEYIRNKMVHIRSNRTFHEMKTFIWHNGYENIPALS